MGCYCYLPPSISCSLHDIHPTTQTPTCGVCRASQTVLPACAFWSRQAKPSAGCCVLFVCCDSGGEGVGYLFEYQSAAWVGGNVAWHVFGAKYIYMYV